MIYAELQITISHYYLFMNNYTCLILIEQNSYALTTVNYIDVPNDVDYKEVKCPQYRGTVSTIQRYSVHYIEVQCLLYRGTVFTIQRYSVHYTEVQCQLYRGTE